MKNVIIILCSIILTYLSIVTLLFNSNNIAIAEQIEFSTADGNFNFMCMPSKGRDYAMMMSAFEKYKSKNNITGTLKVYRTTFRNYLKITSWCRYKSIPEWNHEYLPFWKR